MSDDIIESIDESLEELRAHMALLESIRDQLKGRAIPPEYRNNITSDLWTISEYVNDYGASVQGLMVSVQQAARHKIRIKIEA